MTHPERQKLIESYGQAPSQLIAALKEFPKEMWDYKPGPDRWSIHEIIVHLADAEANSFVRARCFIAEPGKTIMPYDQDKWATELRYDLQDTYVALETFKWLRQMTYLVVRYCPESYFSRTIYHPEHGDMDMDKWLVIYEEHTRKHIGQMRRNHEQWKATQGAGITTRK